MTASSSERFLPGHVYFIVVFSDENLMVPIVQTLVFVKRGKRDDGSRFFLFRELPPHGEESKLIVDEKQADHLVLDQAELLNKLRHSFDGKLATTPPWELSRTDTQQEGQVLHNHTKAQIKKSVKAKKKSVPKRKRLS